MTVFHALRRSAVRNMIEAGVSENVEMKISGHKTPVVCRRYHIASTEDLHRAMNRAQATQLTENNARMMQVLAGATEKPS